LRLFALKALAEAGDYDCVAIGGGLPQLGGLG
jgi:hypothetical protein